VLLSLSRYNYSQQGVTESLETQNQIEIVVNYIDHHVEEQFDSDKLAEIGICSKSHFFKLFTLLE